jgi:hypothetical protein
MLLEEASCTIEASPARPVGLPPAYRWGTEDNMLCGFLMGPPYRVTGLLPRHAALLATKNRIKNWKGIQRKNRMSREGWWRKDSE